eukprot:5203346-Amphidinium_carterae.1
MGWEPVASEREKAALTHSAQQHRHASVSVDTFVSKTLKALHKRGRHKLPALSVPIPPMVGINKLNFARCDAIVVNPRSFWA